MDINGHEEKIEAVVTKLDAADIFIGYNWLTKHNPTINWETGMVIFNNCPLGCHINHSTFEIPQHLRRLKTETEDSPEEKEPDPTNPEDLPDYIRPFTHLFNKKNFDQLPKHTEWDH